MLSRGDAVVYKCRGVYKVEEVGKLDFSFVDGKKDYYTLQSIDNQRDKAYVRGDWQGGNALKAYKSRRTFSPRSCQRRIP